MKWIYKHTEPSLWTVGYYEPDGTFEPESDCTGPDEAAARVHWLNGGPQGSNGGASAADVLHAVLNEAEHDEQCPACEAVYEWDNTRSWCPHHQGMLAGYDKALGDIGETAVAFQRDPDLLGMVVDRAEQLRIHEHQLLQRAENQPEPEGLTEYEKEVRDAVNEAARHNNLDLRGEVDPTAVRLAVDADCPSCGHPERRFNPNTAVYSCRQCPYTSRYRDH